MELQINSMEFNLIPWNFVGKIGSSMEIFEPDWTPAK